MGATDVCPLVPIANITMEECAQLARELAKRVGDELGILYIVTRMLHSVRRRNLANCRAGEYEGIADKFKDPNWKPDFGPAVFNDG